MSLLTARKIALFMIVGMPLAVPAQTTKGGTTPADAVQQFMKALSDSNLTRMAELFGNSSGPVARTQPKGYEKRIILMQLFLHGVQARTLGDVPGTKAGLRTVTTQLTSRSGCKVTIPVNAVKAKEGWLVDQFDLDAASQVNRPCDPSGRSGGNLRD